jgi:hypothetical protein
MPGKPCYVIDLTVKKFSDSGTSLGGAEMSLDVEETGQKRNINGYDASELLMTVDVDSPQLQSRGMKMQMEVHIWLSPGVPGAEELHSFYKRNMGNFPWAAMMQGGNAGMGKSIAELQRKLASMNGVPVLEVMKSKTAGGPSVSPQQQAQMDQARARLEAMAQQGGAQGAAAQQALARMGGAASGGGMEINIESGNFSTAAIPASTFAIPAGFTPADK